MKKIFMVMAVALVSAVMFNACKDDTTPEPTPTPEPQTYVSQWDSTYYFEEDSAWYEKNIVKERNTAENSMLVYAYEWSNYKNDWKPLHVHKYFYDNQDRLALELGCEPDEGFEEYEFNDSTVYFYGNQERTITEYFNSNNGRGYYKTESTHYTLDALDSVLEKVHIRYQNEGTEIFMQEKTTYTYDPSTHLMLSETTSRYNGGQWVDKEKTTYEIKEGKHAVRYDYNFNKADTLSRAEYSYNGTTETIISYEKDTNTKVWSKVPATRIIKTYTAQGDLETTSTYNYDEGNWQYMEGERKFYSLKQK